jgi:hypothetical protein
LPLYQAMDPKIRDQPTYCNRPIDMYEVDPVFGTG